jgi:RNA polymerase sigma factor (sigma-70 family)
MPTARVRTVLGHISQLVGTPPAGDLTDGQLLQRYTSDREKAAFAALLRRHGRLVWGVCRHVLRHDQDAEDAFQATFLVLAHKASSIRKQESVASWLYGVAYRTAMKAKTSAAKRRAHEKGARHSVPEGPPAKAAWRELQALLDHELNRLPEKYRAPFVLCCLEGRSRSEVARALGWKEGTVAGRLGQARKLLQQRLARRGVTLSAVLCAAAVSQQASLAAVPARLLATAADSALLFAVGPGAPATCISAPVIALAKDVLRAMTLSKLKVAMVLLLTAGMAFAVAGMVARKAFAAKPVEAKSEDEPKPRAESAGQPKQEAAKTVRTDRYGDPLPPGAIARMGTVRFRTWATSVAFLPGDKMLATVAQEVVSFWDVATGKETRRRSVDMRWGSAYALSDDGKLLAVGAIPNDNTIHLWEVDTGKHLREFRGHEGWIHALAFAADGRTLISGDTQGKNTVRVWDTDTGKELRRIEVGHPVGGVAVSPDGKLLVAAGWDVASTVSIREMDTGKELHRFKLPLGVHEVIFAPDGKTLADIEDWNDDGGIRENKVHLWDPATGKLRQQFKMREHILCAAFSPDSKTLATGHLQTFHLWDVATGKWQDRFEGHDGRFDRVAFSGDGKTLVTSGENTIRLWDTATGKEMRYSGDGHQAPVDALTFMGKGATLVSASGDHTLRHWDAATGREIRKFSGMGDGVYSPSFVIKERIGAHTVNNEVHLFDPATGKELRRLRYPDRVVRVALTDDGKTLAVYCGGNNLTLRLVETATGKERLARRYPDFVQVIAFSPSGHVLALGPTKPILPVLDTATGNEVYQLRLAENAINLTFSPDGKTMAWGAGYGTLRFWEVATGKERAVWTDRDLRSGSQMAFSPDGLLLALGDADGRLRLISAATGKELKRLQGHGNGFTCLAFAPDGKTLASGNWDTTALIWDISGLKELKEELTVALRAEQLEALWTDLANKDATHAYRAIQDLIAAPKQAVPFLAQHVQPQAPVTDKRIAQLIAELDNERFEPREAATIELAGLEKRAEPLLREALANDPSPEARRRLESLLGYLQAPVTFAPTQRLLRTIEVLEHLATPEARQLMQKLAAGVPDACLTREAKAALERLANR